MQDIDRAPILLEPGFQHYAWGDATFIPRLFGLPVTDQPFAEAWIGSHPALPSIAHPNAGAGVGGDGDSRIALDQLLSRAPDAILGPDVRARFGGLPYLVKILAAARPLSIQVHPSRSQAIAGFRREEEAGIPMDAPARSYRDPNPKPELFVALTRFEALCGFRPAAEIAGAMAAAPEVAALLPRWQENATSSPASFSASLRGLLAAYFDLSDERLLPALGRWTERLRSALPKATANERWLVEADRLFSAPGRPDRGLLFVVLLNLIELEPWQALFLPAGVPHAYLRGAGVEVMASSDNVLRAGLTPKAVNTHELLSLLRFESHRPPVLIAGAPDSGARQGEGTDRANAANGAVAVAATYPTPAEQFVVSRLAVAPGHGSIEQIASGPEVVLFLGGSHDAGLRVESAGRTIELRGAGACLLPAGVRYRCEATAPGTVVRVGVPAARSTNVFRGNPVRQLVFGTSGLRGLVSDITDLEAYVNARGFLDYLVQTGDVRAGISVALAGDLRPSTDSPERSIMRAVAWAIADAGFTVVNCGKIPTPALASFALRQRWPGIMVTGSHIPFDRNGIKFYRTTGEILKSDEAPILTAVGEARRAAYACPAAQSPFDDDGMFRTPPLDVLPAETAEASRHYVRRFLDFFPADALSGMRILVYQHSAVGRDMVVDVLRSLGAEVHPAGRTTTFVPIDTEAITDLRLREVQQLAEDARGTFGAIDAIVSTDGDSDRPMVLGVDGGGIARFIPGDVLGILVADYLGADALAVPVTCTDAVELHFSSRAVRSLRTRVGSPWVIAAMPALTGNRKVGWEANGGFLTFSDIERHGRTMSPLPTRDALLPILAVLHAARERRSSVSGVAAALPRRFTRAGLLDGVPEDAVRALADYCASGDAAIVAAIFSAEHVRTLDSEGRAREESGPMLVRLGALRAEIARHFNAARGFSAVAGIDFLDGLRVTFDGGDIAHIRPSGNAPQVRIYALAASEERAAAIVDLGLREPDGIVAALLRAALARAVGSPPVSSSR